MENMEPAILNLGPIQFVDDDDDNRLPWEEVDKTAEYQSYSDLERLRLNDSHLYENNHLPEILPESSTESSPQLKFVTETKQFVEIEKNSSKAKDGSYKTQNDIIVARPFSPNDKKNQIKFRNLEHFDHRDQLQIFMEVQRGISTRSDNSQEVPLAILDQNLSTRCECFDEHNFSSFCVKSDDARVVWEKNAEMGSTHVATLTPVNKSKFKFVIRLLNANFKKDFAALIGFHHMRDGITIYEQKYFIKTGRYVGRTFENFSELVEKGFVGRNKWFKEEKQDPNSNENKLRNPLKIKIPKKDLQKLLDLLDESDSKYVMNQLPQGNDPGTSGGGNRRAPSPDVGGGKRSSK